MILQIITYVLAFWFGFFICAIFSNNTTAELQLENSELQKENEELKGRLNKSLKVCFNEEQLEKIKNDCLENVEYNIKEIKSEAVKEFAERLKGIYTNDRRYDFKNAHTLIDKLFANIDNLLKEQGGKK